ncbi:MAG: metal-dependent hydrolase [Enterovirga sp.]|nr:metal-dependent hydrolase [Enterovirga sp.]
MACTMLSLFRRITPADEPSHLVVEHEGRRFDVALRRRPGVRRITLRVSSATGLIALTLPVHTPLRAARAFADSHGGWIAARVARIPERLGFEPGATVPLRGVPHTVVHRPGTRLATRAAHRPGGPAIEVGGEAAAVPGRVKRFLAAEAARDLRVAVDRYTGTIGIPARRIAVRDTKSRWGSCSSTGTLSFSWRLIMAPPFVLDYLAAHEVAHLKELNHSARFWALTRALCPGTDEAEAWLKRKGGELHRYG